jgi:2-keto-3-deoxy-L-rhamnonate aldolase RhmA
LVVLLLLPRPQLGRSTSDYLATANDGVALIIQVETKQCYEDLEASSQSRCVASVAEAH